MRTTLLFVLWLCTGVAFAQGTPRVEHVKFPEGATSLTFSDTVHGDEPVDHRLQGRAGQVMTVRLDTKDAYFNVIAPGAGDVAVYNSSTDMNTWTGSLMKDGEYTVRVYQKPNAKRGNAAYTLRITLHGGNGARTTPPPAKEAKPVATSAKRDVTTGLTTRYTCNGLAVATTQRKPGNDLVLEVRGRALTLAQAKSASGAKFEDAKGNAFWSKGNEATLTLAGEQSRKCAQQG